MSKTNGQSPRPTKVVWFRTAIRGPGGVTLGSINDTQADWSWTHGGGMLEVRYYGSSLAKTEAMAALEERGQCAVPVLMVPISNIANITILDAVLQQQSRIVPPPPSLIEKV